MTPVSVAVKVAVPPASPIVTSSTVRVAVSLSAIVLVAVPAAVIEALDVAAVSVTTTVSPPSTIVSCRTGMVMVADVVLAGIITVRGSAV